MLCAGGGRGGRIHGGVESGVHRAATADRLESNHLWCRVNMARCNIRVGLPRGELAISAISAFSLYNAWTPTLGDEQALFSCFFFVWL